MNQTIEYYNKNAQEYYNKTVKTDMSRLCDRFLKYVKAGGIIIDIGCGSGRDMKYFIGQGYQAVGIDASYEMCKMARSLELDIENVSIEEWIPERKYDGIWANASLLHVPFPKIDSFFQKAKSCMNAGGIVFISMKVGLKEEYDEEGRYFFTFSETILDSLLEKHRVFCLRDKWYSDDKLGRNEFQWLNFILEKSIDAVFKEDELVKNQKR